MKPPTEFLQGFGIGAGLIAVVAAISLFSRPGLIGPAQTRPAPAGKLIVEPRSVGEEPALLPQDYLDLCGTRVCKSPYFFVAKRGTGSASAAARSAVRCMPLLRRS